MPRRKLNGADVAIERVAVNPVTWSVEMGFNQGEVVTGDARTLYCSGQTAMGADGTSQHEEDMAAQVALALDNLEAVLAAADMSLANLIRLNVYTTDVDLLFQHYGVLVARLGAAQVAPTTTMLGVTRLAIPGHDLGGHQDGPQDRPVLHPHHDLARRDRTGDRHLGGVESACHSRTDP